MSANPQFSADLFTFTKDISNGKHYFLCIVYIPNFRNILVLLEKLLIVISTQGFPLRMSSVNVTKSAVVACGFGHIY